MHTSWLTMRHEHTTITVSETERGFHDVPPVGPGMPEILCRGGHSSRAPDRPAERRPNVRRSRSLRWLVKKQFGKIPWYVKRATAMSPAELAGRFWEAWRRCTEARDWRQVEEMRLCGRCQDAFVVPAAETAPPELKTRLAQDAAALCAGRWNLFGWHQSKMPLPPDWGRDVMRDVDASLENFVDHRSLACGAEPRNIWEINRWAEMVRLAMHAHVNGDSAAIGAAQQWLENWVQRNVPGRGINWTSALEGALRLINFCWFDVLVLGNAAVSPEALRRQRALVDEIVPTHVWWVRRRLSFGSSANNHRIGELVGLLLAVKRWPEMARIAGTPKALWKEIVDCVLAQFAEDGGNREQALHYHLFAFEMALHACRAMDITNGPVIERLRNAAGFFVRMSHAQEPWDYGDSDDAQIVPLTMRREEVVAEWRAWMAGKTSGAAAALNFWLGDAPMCHPESAVGTGGWWVAKGSGMAVMERAGWKVRVDASPLGFGKLAAHGHCDALHASIWDGEEALVIDPGTGGYSGSQEARAWLASWSAHNGPQPLGGHAVPRRAGTFLWTAHHPRPEVEDRCGELHVRMSSGGGRFFRRVRFLEGTGQIAILDSELSGQAFLVRWHLSPDCEVHCIDPATSIFRITRGTRQWTMSFLLGSESDGVEIVSGTCSPAFGNIRPCPVIEARAKGRLRTEWRRV